MFVKMKLHAIGKESSLERNNTTIFTLNKNFHNNEKSFRQFLELSPSFLIQNRFKSLKDSSSDMSPESGLSPPHLNLGLHPNLSAYQSVS